MRTQTKSIYALVAVLVATTTLACGLFANVREKVSTAKGTAQAFVTEVKGLATEGQELVGTAQAFATENPGLLQTAEAFITEQPGVLETAQAFATQGVSADQIPEDIPLPPEDQINNYYGTSSMASFSTDLDFQSVLDFYKTEMVANGWEYEESSSYESEGNAVLTYSRSDRTATAIISNISGTTTVLITVLSK
jgi:hypothetical protein